MTCRSEIAIWSRTNSSFNRTNTEQ